MKFQVKKKVELKAKGKETLTCDNGICDIQKEYHDSWFFKALVKEGDIVQVKEEKEEKKKKETKSKGK